MNPGSGFGAVPGVPPVEVMDAGFYFPFFFPVNFARQSWQRFAGQNMPRCIAPCPPRFTIL